MFGCLWFMSFDVFSCTAQLLVVSVLYWKCHGFYWQLGDILGKAWYDYCNLIHYHLKISLIESFCSLSLLWHMIKSMWPTFNSSQYVKVMPGGGQCYERGPFFPAVPRHMTRMGISRRRDLLLRPDWVVTSGLLFGAVVILCLCVILLVGLKTRSPIAFLLLLKCCWSKCIQSMFRSSSGSMGGQGRSQSKQSTVCCSWLTKWMTIHQKVQEWCHVERLTANKKREWHKTPFSQVDILVIYHTQTHAHCSFIKTNTLHNLHPNTFSEYA